MFVLPLRYYSRKAEPAAVFTHSLGALVKIFKLLISSSETGQILRRAEKKPNTACEIKLDKLQHPKYSTAICKIITFSQVCKKGWSIATYA